MADFCHGHVATGSLAVWSCGHRQVWMVTDCDPVAVHVLEWLPLRKVPTFEQNINAGVTMLIANEVMEMGFLQAFSVGSD